MYHPVGHVPDGVQKILSVATGTSEEELFWSEFLRGLSPGAEGGGGLCGVKLVISDAHEGLKAAITKVLKATR